MLHQKHQTHTDENAYNCNIARMVIVLFKWSRESASEEGCQ